ncbi:response regulator [Candidatus Zixiibacteriota bacterium]
MADDKKAVILVVDDQPENIDVLSGILKDEYQVKAAINGTKALEIATSDNPPDLILLDIMMPEIDGYEVCRRLKAEPATERIPIMFVTAMGETEDETKGLELGAVDYLTKPVNVSITRARVRTHLNLKMAYQTLEEQNVQLVEAAELREDVDRISRHDLKNPLAVILGAPDVIGLEKNLSERQEKMLGMIRTSGYRMLDMIDRSLDLYKMETGAYTFDPEEVDLVEVFDKIKGEVEPRCSEKDITCGLTIDGKPAGDEQAVKTEGEPLLCYSMLANLIKNAIEAAPEGSTISIDLKSGATPAASIRNQGAVPEEIRERFFEKYVTSGKKKGTGLGTYSARLIAETLGGSIELDSSEADHTTITVTLKPA